LVQTRRRLREKVDATLGSVRGACEYDAIVAFSGGKDSSFTLWLLATQYKLRCLAVTVDNGFLSPGGILNCHRMVDSLGVDFTLYKPSFTFMRDMYVKSLDGSVHVKSAVKRASGICNSCIGLINNSMIKLALRHRVPMVAGGYLGGQVPKDAAVMVMDRARLSRLKATNLAHYRQHFGDAAEKHFSISQQEIDDMEGDAIHVLNPLLAFDYSEREIIETIGRHGWNRPNDTGAHSSNCRLNDVGILAHHRRYGFHPYEFELADLVRKGLMSRRDALSKVEHLPSSSEMADVLDKLGIQERQI
jgi:tRNA(Ile)-lysidine synthase TilS/MesJ